jgi:hypothetical protein
VKKPVVSADSTFRFDPALLFIALADGSAVTCVRAAVAEEALAYIERLRRKNLLEVKLLDAARFSIRLTDKGLLVVDRTIAQMRVTVEKVRDVLPIKKRTRTRSPKSSA